MNEVNEVIVIALDWGAENESPMSLGQMSIIATMRQHGIGCTGASWAVNHQGFNPEEVVDYVLKHDPRIIGIGAYVWNHAHILAITRSLKEQGFSGLIVIGGPQVSYLDHHPQKMYPNGDMFVRGHGENAMVQICQSTSLESASLLPGVSVNGRPFNHTEAVAELGNIPSPILTDMVQPSFKIRLETQRSCPYGCTFCQYHGKLDGQGMGRKKYDLDEERLMQEIAWVCAHPEIRYLQFVDPIFNVGKYHLKVLDGLIDGGFSGKVTFETRPEIMSKAFMDKVEQLGNKAYVILEFGLQTIHKNESNAVNRGNNMDKIAPNVAEANRRGLNFEFTLIYGLPLQTVESFKQTLDWCRSTGANSIYAFPLMVCPGTQLERDVEKFGLKVSATEDSNESRVMAEGGIPYVVASPTFSYADYQEMALMAADLAEYNAQHAVHKVDPIWRSAKIQSKVVNNGTSLRAVI